MRLCCAVSLAWTLAASVCAQDSRPSVASVAAELQGITLDPAQSYYVRDLQISRGDIKLYLSEGLLSFTTPVQGRCLAAVFTTEHTEAGDAEVITLPAQRSERASLAHFTKAPNLDEHFRSAVILFSDDAQRELMAQIQERPIRKVMGEELSTEERVIHPVLQSLMSNLDTSMIKALLDRHQPKDGFFYGLISGNELGNFAVLYEPTQPEPISIGRSIRDANGERNFQLWAAFRPRRAPPYVPPPPRVRNYELKTDIHPDLSMAVQADFEISSSAADGRVLAFTLSHRLKVSDAQIDGRPAEVFQHGEQRTEGGRESGSFLLISDAVLPAGSSHRVKVRYEGSVIRKTSGASHFVDERNAWYPQCGPTLANFDLSFRLPKNLRLVSTGEPISETEDAETRTVHRKTRVPEALAGFNLGDYEAKSASEGDYRIECFADKGLSGGLDRIEKQTEDVLRFYFEHWGGLPVRSLAVSPIPGYFGQGFPGLIYLSTTSYMKPENRPATMRNTLGQLFFSELLLPHEVAHQWWGNVVTAADYRTNWLVEAMANSSALDFLEKGNGARAVHQILDSYREDLLRKSDSRSLESAGPLDFGFRLIDNYDLATWQAITYEKGTWVLRMLRNLIGDDRFHQMQLRLLRNFASRPITNEDFRKVASEFVPPAYADKDLSLFFATWVYNTGIPTLHLAQSSSGLALSLSGTAPDFTVDVPMQCRSRGIETVRWVRASYGSETLPGSLASVGCALPSRSEYLYIQ